jgi:hypothetical protein
MIFSTETWDLRIPSWDHSKTRTETVYFNKTVWFSNELKLDHGCALIKCKQLGLEMLTFDSEMELYGFHNGYVKRPFWFEEFTLFGAYRPDTEHDKWFWLANGKSADFLPPWGPKKGGGSCTMLMKKSDPKEFPPVYLYDQDCTLRRKFFCAATEIKVWLTLNKTFCL